MLSPVPVMRHLETPASPRRPAALADDLLEEILLRVASPADLVRASAASTSFRRFVTDATFLRRYRSLHPPLLLGFIEILSSTFQPAEAPHPNAPVARSLGPATGFSFDYLPPARWSPWAACDVRDGRILLKSIPTGFRGVTLPDLAVCDPLSRRYRLLPPIPDELASVHVQLQNCRSFEAFFAPTGEEEDETSFRVIGTACCPIKSVPFVFSSGSGVWSAGTTWNDYLGGSILHHFPCYAYGSIYWKVIHTNMLYKLNINAMEFSTVDLPPRYKRRDVIIVEAGEDRVGVFSHVRFGNVVYYAIQQKEGKIADDCHTETIIRLPGHYPVMLGAAEGYVFFAALRKDPMVDAASFSLQVKTLKIEKVCRMMSESYYIQPYFGFPPSMSPRRI